MADPNAAPSGTDEVPIPLKGLRRDPDHVRRILGQWLAPRVGGGQELSVSPLTTPTGTGVANETLLFDARWSSGGSERRERFVARLATERALYLDADIEIHARIYEALADVPDVPVPRVYGYEGDAELLGAPFFVMERIEGEVPGDSPHWNTAGFVFDASPQRRRAMWEEAVAVLAALHQVDSSRFSFLARHPGSGGLADHLAYWRRSLDYGTVGMPHEVLERGYEWLTKHFPDPAPEGFSWGDSRFANIMFRDDRVVSIFDWDTASLAAPESDLAWWRYMDGPSAVLEGIGGPDELVERWQQHTGRTARHLEWFDVFTLFRLGTIMINLFHNMAADGHLPTEEAIQQGRNAAPTQDLAVLLDQIE